MTAAAGHGLRLPSRRDLRLGSGLVLLAYIAAHLANHALGLVSLDAAERGLGLAVRIWHSLPGTVLLYGAAGVHLLLALHAIYQRRSLRLPPAEVVRILLGLGMPILVIGHIAATRLALELHALPPEYARIVWSLRSSDSEGRQLALLAPGWLHGCMGLHFAFSHRPAYRRMLPLLFGVALLMPVLSALGFIAMGRELGAMAADPAWRAAQPEAPDATQRVAIGRLRDSLLTAYFVLVGVAFGARWLRGAIEHQRGSTLRIRYPGRTVRVPRGWSVLEASRGHAIAHASQCGGRARCSTCRVRVTEGLEHCPAPNEDEQNTLARIHAAPDVRLACQLRPAGDLAVLPLLTPTATPVREEHDPDERDMALLVVEAPGLAAFARGHSSYDTLYLQRRVTELVGASVRAAGGEAHELPGGAVLALFAAATPDEACKAALAAARDVAAVLRNASAGPAGSALPSALDACISLHAGALAGWRAGSGTLPAGAALHDLMALHALAVRESARLVVSARAAHLAGADTSGWKGTDLGAAAHRLPAWVADTPVDA
jgi:adenylate cyclase